MVGTGVTAAVVSGQLTFTALTSGSAYAVVDAGVANVDMSFTIATQQTGQIGVAARYVDTNNGLLLARVSDPDRSWRLVKRVAGASTEVAQLGVTMASGDVVRVRCSGETVTVWINGTQRWTGTVTEHATATKFGAYLGASGSSQVNGRWDDLVIEAA